MLWRIIALLYWRLLSPSIFLSVYVCFFVWVSVFPYLSITPLQWTALPCLSHDNHKVPIRGVSAGLLLIYWYFDLVFRQVCLHASVGVDRSSRFKSLNSFLILHRQIVLVFTWILSHARGVDRSSQFKSLNSFLILHWQLVLVYRGVWSHASLEDDNWPKS